MLRSIVMVSILAALGSTACTDDEKKLEEPVAAEANDKHDFSVSKDGKVSFTAEIVYFHFDDYTLTKEGMERLNALAAYLNKHPKQKLKIEGHCDERGSTEYNLALGQLRAQSVRKHLATLGISNDRLDAVSFGEEKPALKGNGESNWAKNRRAEFEFVSN